MKLRFIVQSIEQELVVLIADDDQAVVWPRQKLPEQLIIGQILYFNINDDLQKIETTVVFELSSIELINQILKI